jgi:hypothetical protein
MMTDIQSLACQIKHNCNISDARYWGMYSLCGLLLRLRELYKVEKGIRPWENILQLDIGEWITGRENLWQELEDKDFGNIYINGDMYGPFEVEKINTELEKSGVVYGAGYGVHMKPSFFLADIVSKEHVTGFTVYITGSEYARDLSDYPAMLQGRTILSRVNPTNLILWGKFEEMRSRKFKGALAYAFSHYGITPDDQPSAEIDRKIYQIALSEAKTYVHHELGEAAEGEKIGGDWKILLSSLPDGRAELFARAVKDILSDTSEHGMLKHIIQNRKEGSLGFYIVFLGGLRKIIFPEIVNAFQQFIETGDWEVLDNVRYTGYKKAEAYAERLLSIFRRQTDNTSLPESIENEILSGLL